MIEAAREAPRDKDDNKRDDVKALFRVDQVLKGKGHLATGRDGKPLPLRVLCSREKRVGTQVLLTGFFPHNKPDTLRWWVEEDLSRRGVEYLHKLASLPPGGSERAAFFLDYVQDGERALAWDAFDELARVEYRDLKTLGPRLDPKRLRQWIADQDVGSARKRLYLMLLAVCGNGDDVKMLRDMLNTQPDQDGFRGGVSLEPIVFAYLALSESSEAVDTIDRLFLANRKTPYPDLYCATLALRLLGQEESKKVSRKRILRSFHYLLDRPEYADLVIPDLARWNDWSVMDRLVELFKGRADDTAWVRMPVVLYLKACPLPRARLQLAELSKIDAEVIQRAEQALARWNSTHDDHPWRLQPDPKR